MSEFHESIHRQEVESGKLWRRCCEAKRHETNEKPALRDLAPPRRKIRLIVTREGFGHA